jgi:phosphate starvation-inducible PhoH-like protein
VTLEFKKNAHLAALAGSHSRHLVRLEHKLGVKIAMRGNLISIEGEPRAREQAAAVLRSLYERAELGEEVAPADVDAEIGFAGEDLRDIARPAAAGLRTAAGKNTRPRTAAQAAYIDLMRRYELVFGIGPAGTGKTYLAAAFGAHLLHERRVERLVLCRPALEAGERLGFLPGDLKEKIDPYLRPLYDALFDVMGDKCMKLMETGIIEVAPLAFMRGRTLARAFVILDEAQNCTPGQMKMY